MPNLEELIAIRNESIKQQDQYLEEIEKYIKEFSITYYQEYINKNLSKNAKTDPMSDLAITFTDEKMISSQYYNHGSAFFDWAMKVTDNNINHRVLWKYVNLEKDAVNRIIAVQATESNEEKEEFLFIRPSYIKELAEQDNLVFEETELKDTGFTEVYTVSATIPKIDLDKHKVLIKKN